MIGLPQNPAIPPLVGLVRTIRDCCQRKEGEMCRKLALTASQFACLLSLPEQGEEANIRQVAKTMGLSPSRTSRIVDSMVRRKLLSRRATDSDRRTQLLSLTAAGRKKWQVARRLLAECEQNLLDKLSGERPRELQEALQALINAW